MVIFISTENPVTTVPILRDPSMDPLMEAELLENIRSHFTFNGGDNDKDNDKLYLDDSNIRSEVGVVTSSTVNGFGGENDNNSYGLRQVVSVDAVSGTYRISLLGEKTVPIAYDASEETFRNALEPILNPNNLIMPNLILRISECLNLEMIITF